MDARIRTVFICFGDKALSQENVHVEVGGAAIESAWHDLQSCAITI